MPPTPGRTPRRSRRLSIMPGKTPGNQLMGETLKPLSPMTPGWTTGNPDMFKTPKSISPPSRRKTTRRIAEVKVSTVVKVSKQEVQKAARATLSPRMTRARRASMYVEPSLRKSMIPVTNPVKASEEFKKPSPVKKTAKSAKKSPGKKQGSKKSSPKKGTVTRGRKAPVKSSPPKSTKSPPKSKPALPKPPKSKSPPKPKITATTKEGKQVSVKRVVTKTEVKSSSVTKSQEKKAVVTEKKISTRSPSPKGDSSRKKSVVATSPTVTKGNKRKSSEGHQGSPAVKKVSVILGEIITPTKGTPVKKATPKDSKEKNQKTPVSKSQGPTKVVKIKTPAKSGTGKAKTPIKRKVTPARPSAPVAEKLRAKIGTPVSTTPSGIKKTHVAQFLVKQGTTPKTPSSSEKKTREQSPAKPKTREQSPARKDTLPKTREQSPARKDTLPKTKEQSPARRATTPKRLKKETPASSFSTPLTRVIASENEAFSTPRLAPKRPAEELGRESQAKQAKVDVSATADFESSMEESVLVADESTSPLTDVNVTITDTVDYSESKNDTKLIKHEEDRGLLWRYCTIL